jgi:hypothetical protein
MMLYIDESRATSMTANRALKQIHIHRQPNVLCCFHKQEHDISALHELPLLEDVPKLLVQGLLLLVGQVSYDLDVNGKIVSHAWMRHAIYRMMR